MPPQAISKASIITKISYTGLKCLSSRAYTKVLRIALKDSTSQSPYLKRPRISLFFFFVLSTSPPTSIRFSSYTSTKQFYINLRQKLANPRKTYTSQYIVSISYSRIDRTRFLSIVTLLIVTTKPKNSTSLVQKVYLLGLAYKAQSLSFYNTNFTYYLCSSLYFKQIRISLRYIIQIKLIRCLRAL